MQASGETEAVANPTGGDVVVVVSPGEQWTVVGGSETAFGGLRGSQQMEAVTASANGLVAVGADDASGDLDAAVWRSRDGVEWSRVDAGNPALAGDGRQVMTDVVAGGPGFIAVGSGTNPAVSSEVEGVGFVEAVVWTSADGETWTRGSKAQSLTADDPCLLEEPATSMSAVAAGGPGFVAVGTRNCRAHQHAAVWTSTDGLTWEMAPPDREAALGPGDQIMRDIVERDGTLVAVGQATEGNAFSVPAAWASTDGITWTRAPDPPLLDGTTKGTLYAVTATETGFVAVGVTAADPSQTFLNAGHALERSNSIFVLASQSMDAAVWLSADGLSWAPVDETTGLFTESEAQGMLDVSVAYGGLVAVGFTGVLADRDAAVWLSEDGTEWRKTDDAAEFARAGVQQASGVIEGGQGLVSVGFGGSLLGFDAAVWTSP